MSTTIDEAFETASRFLTQALDEIGVAKDLAGRGDLDGALAHIHRGVGGRLTHAQLELGVVSKMLKERGAVYPAESSNPSA